MGNEGKALVANRCGACNATHEEASLCALAQAGLDSVGLKRAHKTYDAGQNVYLESDPSEGVYCLKSGLIAIRKTDINGNSAVVRLVQPGEAFGHRSLLANEKHAGTAEVLTKSTLCFIPKQNIETLISNSPDTAIRFTRRIARDLREIEELYLITTTQPVRKRLSYLLLNLQTRYAQTETAQDSLTIELPLSRQELAAAIGTRPETIARTIKKLEDDGIAYFNGRMVNIPSVDNLIEDYESES